MLLDDYIKIERNVLHWLENMLVGVKQYKMNKQAGASIFSSIFALYIYILFNKPYQWNSLEKKSWANYIQLYQDEKTGLFIPDGFSCNLNSKPVYQLTAFCLSALNHLNAKPKYKLTFIKQFKKSGDINNYLKTNGCLDGYPSSGNMAMFLAIFLTYEYENTGGKKYIDLINIWFDEHNKNINKETGYWGDWSKKHPFLGFQNGFHQYLIYNYWSQEHPYYKKIVDNILNLQDNRGHFAPYPGGGGCYDLDATDTLINFGYKKGYRKEEIKKALFLLYENIIKSQNIDGGFCETIRIPESLFGIFSLDMIKFILSTHNISISKYKFKKLKSCIHNRVIKTHWVKDGRLWNESNMWDTWFRLLTIAEIDTIINFSNLKWGFLNTIGLGWVKK